MCIPLIRACSRSQSSEVDRPVKHDPGQRVAEIGELVVTVDVDIETRPTHPLHLALERQMVEVLLFGYVHCKVDRVSTTGDVLGRTGRRHHLLVAPAAILLSPVLEDLVLDFDDGDLLGLLGLIAHLDQRLSANRADPVVFFEPKRVYRAAKGEVPEGDYTVSLGSAAIARGGDDVTVLAYGAMRYEALDAAQKAEDEGGKPIWEETHWLDEQDILNSRRLHEVADDVIAEAKRNESHTQVGEAA